MIASRIVIIDRERIHLPAFSSLMNDKEKCIRFLIRPSKSQDRKKSPSRRVIIGSSRKPPYFRTRYFFADDVAKYRGKS